MRPRWTPTASRPGRPEARSAHPCGLCHPEIRVRTCGQPRGLLASRRQGVGLGPHEFGWKRPVDQPHASVGETQTCPLAARRATLKQLAAATWIVREPGSGTREASDRWLSAELARVEVELELGSNEAVKRAVASGLGIGCLSRHAVADALHAGWLVELKTPLPAMRRSLAIVVHRTKRLGAAAQGFLRHCLAAGPPLDKG